MKFKFIVNILFFFICSTLVYSQDNVLRSGISNILNAKNPEDIGIRNAIQINADEQKPLEYGIVNDKDILWSTMIWEVIDLDERINFPLLYPVEFDIVGRERRPMLWWLRQEIEKGNLDVYDAGFDEGEFLEKVPKQDLASIFKIMIKTDEGNRRITEVKQELINIITDQENKYKGNPYENEIPQEVKDNISKDSSFIKIFPYTIKNFESNYNLLTSREFSYEMFKGYVNVDEDGYSGEPVRIMQPGGYADPLTPEEVIEYNGVLEELIIDLFFIEGVDFYYKPLGYADVKQWLIKGLWYFDKKYSELIYRPIGLAPVTIPLSVEDSDPDDGSSVIWAGNYEAPLVEGTDTDGDGVADIDEIDNYFTLVDNPDTDGDLFNDGDEINKWFTEPTDSASFPSQEMIDEFNKDPKKEKKEEKIIKLRPIFWVYYPHAREILKKGRAFNDRNTSASKSFDDIINSRRFNAVIYKEENVYENRYIKDYIPNNAFMRLLESERIREKIRNFEHDMWSW